VVQLTFNIAAFALWLLDAILWSLAAIAGWVGLVLAILAAIVDVVRRRRGR